MCACACVRVYKDITISVGNTRSSVMTATTQTRNKHLSIVVSTLMCACASVCIFVYERAYNRDGRTASGGEIIFAWQLCFAECVYMVFLPPRSTLLYRFFYSFFPRECIMCIYGGDSRYRPSNEHATMHYILLYSQQWHISMRIIMLRRHCRT